MNGKMRVPKGYKLVVDVRSRVKKGDLCWLTGGQVGWFHPTEFVGLSIADAYAFPRMFVARRKR